MEYIALSYPGTRLEGLNPSQAAEIMTLLTVCENYLLDAALGLSMYEEARAVLVSTTEQQAANVPDLRPEKNENGQLPIWYRYRLPFVHAHTVLYALDGVMKVLAVLAAEPSLPPEIREISSTFETSFPSLKHVRDSSHHLEDRARGLGKFGKRLTLKPITAGAINAPDGGVLGIDNLDNDRLGFTGSDGSYHQVEIAAATIRVAKESVQRVIEAFQWSGPRRFIP